MKFVIEGTFDAENIDDAFYKLAKHFSNLVEYGIDAPSEFEEWEVEIYPLSPGPAEEGDLGIA